MAILHQRQGVPSEIAGCWAISPFHKTGCCAGGRTLYAGTESGCIRCYRLPLTGEFQEYRCFSTTVLRLCMGSEGALLFATSADGAIATFDAKERDPTRMPRRCFASPTASGADSQGVQHHQCSVLACMAHTVQQDCRLAERDAACKHGKLTQEFKSSWRAGIKERS